MNYMKGGSDEMDFETEDAVNQYSRDLALTSHLISHPGERHSDPRRIGNRAQSELDEEEYRQRERDSRLRRSGAGPIGNTAQSKYTEKKGGSGERRCDPRRVGNRSQSELDEEEYRQRECDSRLRRSSARPIGNTAQSELEELRHVHNTTKAELDKARIELNAANTRLEALIPRAGPIERKRELQPDSPDVVIYDKWQKEIKQRYDVFAEIVPIASTYTPALEVILREIFLPTMTTTNYNIWKKSKHENFKCLRTLNLYGFRQAPDIQGDRCSTCKLECLQVKKEDGVVFGRIVDMAQMSRDES
jgi:hypothetical protein